MIFFTDVVVVGFNSSNVILLRTCLGRDTFRGMNVELFSGIEVGTYMFINGSDSGADTVLYYTALLKFRSIFD